MPEAFIKRFHGKAVTEREKILWHARIGCIKQPLITATVPFM